MQTIIEVDGNNVEPLVVDSIHIFTGQRYSIVLDANKTVDNYWIRAQPVDTTVVDGINMAILRYSGAPSAEPRTTSNLTNPMLETNLHPLVNPGAPGKPRRGDVDIALNLNLAFDATNFKYSINGATFVPPTAPVLLQILSGARSAHDLLPPGSVYTLPRNKVVEISIPGGSRDPPVRNSSPIGDHCESY
jgi:iron transport multicopper oxidase